MGQGGQAVVLCKTTNVMVVVPGERVEAGLAQSVGRHGWTLLLAPTMGQALREVHRRRPYLVIQQICPPLERSLNMIRHIRRGQPYLPLIAAAVQRDENVEQQARGAGASYYLPDAMKSDQIDEAVSAVLEQTATAHEKAALARTG